MLKKICLGVLVAAALACEADPRVKLTGNLKPDAQQAVVARELVTMLEEYHYKKIAVNDSVSSLIFDQYLKLLDANHIYLLKSDVDEFEKYRLSLDDDFHEGDLSAAFYIFNVWQKRYDERMRYSLTQVDKKYDFNGNETYTYNREKLPWFSSEAEANETWNKRVKYDLLNLKITGADEAKNKKTIKQRYESLISQSAKINSQDVFQRVMDALTSAVDPHTNYFNPVNAQVFNEDMARTFEGIGARLQLENEVVKIVEIIPGGPAFKARTVNVNDKIIAVAQGDGEFTDVIGWRLDNTVAKIKGPKGTKVRLKIIPAGQEISAKPRIVELVRDKVILEEQSAKKQIKTIKSGDKSYKIGVIEIPGFYLDFKAYNAGDKNYKSTTRDVKLILDTLKQQNVDGVVIDLRANGGGSLLEAIDLTGLFIKTGPVVQVRDSRNRVEINDDDDPEIAWNGPLGVMVDRFSASASEIFAGAIQDYGRGVIMGTQTYGKGTVQSSIDMAKVISPAERMVLSAKGTSKDKTNSSGPGTEGAPRFGQVNLTMAKFYRVNGSSTQHKGVMPDIEFPMVFPADKYGESSEPAALPWDEIKPSGYKAVANLTSIKQQLAGQHQQRLKNSKEYQYLLEDIKQFGKREEETNVTLNETTLKKERDEQETKNFERENQRRALNGLPALVKGQAKPKDDVDFIQDESLQVMADFIKLSAGNKLTQTGQKAGGG